MNSLTSIPTSIPQLRTATLFSGGNQVLQFRLKLLYVLVSSWTVTFVAEFNICGPCLPKTWSCHLMCSLGPTLQGRYICIIKLLCGFPLLPLLVVSADDQLLREIIYSLFFQNAIFPFKVREQCGVVCSCLCWEHLGLTTLGPIWIYGFSDSLFIDLETESHCVALVGLKLLMETRLALNSQVSIFLPLASWVHLPRVFPVRSCII